MLTLLRTQRRGSMLSFLLLFAIAGCGTSVETRPRLATIETSIEGFGVEIGSPATVQADERFEVSIQTYGGGCILNGGRENTDIEIADVDVIIRPYDLEIQHPEGVLNPNCADILQVFNRTIDLTLPDPGDYTLTIVGMSTLTGDTLRVPIPIRVD